MPAGAIWRPEHAPRAFNWRGWRQALIRDFPAGAPVLLRRAAHSAARSASSAMSSAKARTSSSPISHRQNYPAFFARRLARHISRATRFPAHRADRAQYSEARNQA